jgi:hypothetical protein
LDLLELQDQLELLVTQVEQLVLPEPLDWEPLELQDHWDLLVQLELLEHPVPRAELPDQPVQLVQQDQLDQPGLLQA